MKRTTENEAAPIVQDRGGEMQTNGRGLQVQDNPIPAAAHALAAAGWKIHPTRKGSKVALWPAWQHRASADSTHWQAHPDDNIALLTGGGWFALDIDRKNGKDGFVALAALEATHGKLPATLTASTPGSGEHRYFACAEAIPCSTSKIGDGLDLKGTHGYILAPPSVIEGKRYAWTDLSPVAAAPRWLIEMALAAAPVSAAPAGEPVEIEVTDELVEDLRSALAVLDASDRDVWVACAGALRCLQDCGYQLWLDWSQGSDKYQDGDENTFYTVGADRTGYAAILAKAQAAGWINPRSTLARAAGIFGQPLPGDAPALMASSPCTNLANAHRIVRSYGARLLYVPSLGWHVRDEGGPWRCDELAARKLVQGLGRLIAAEASGIAAEAAAEEDKERREARQKAATALLKWAASSESAKVLDHSLSMAAALLNCAAGELDADVDVLGTPSGVLDLRTGKCRPYVAGDRITKITNAEFDPSVEAPHWTRFVSEILGGDAELIEYVQRLAGYALSGRREHHLLPMALGSGRNGKSTFLGALQYALGSYAGAAAPGLLMQRYGTEHPTALADLQGLRLVIASETGEAGRLNEEQVKLLTGSDSIKARRMGRDFYQFQPSHLLVMQSNHRPKVTGTDLGIWRRIKLLPFNVTIPEDKCDATLPEKLRTEAAGILAWCWRGWLAYRAHGFNMPAAVDAATNEYRTSSDVVGAWLADSCEIEPGATAAAAELYANYSGWCHANGERPRSQNEVGTRLSERGFERFRTRAGIRWRGVGLCSPFGKSVISGAPINYSNSETTG